MTNNKNTRNALFMSVISLMLCVSMLVGTTFAWFTDEVVTGMNTIAAGNLDVELLADGDKVDGNTKLFDDVTLWEPGVVVYENLQVSNVGTLALKYQMTLNFGNENDLNGHKLSEVLKVAVLDQTIDASTQTREDVLELAKTAIVDAEKDATLSNFYLTGELEANTASAGFAVVIFWEPNDNATDNLYNANNGKATSDGEPLHIEFGVNLQATQLMSEEDSFGPDYDASASILPKATVNNTGAKTVPVFTGINATELELDTSFQFLPNEAADIAAVSEYKDWHADYVVVADKDVPAGSIALAGYYEAWCGNNGWVVLTGDEVKAGKEVRLVAGLLSGTTVSYEEICQYGNDGGFLCGAADLTGENAGTTITVELRMYEVDPDSSSLSTTASETGKYEVIGRYTYTFKNEVSTAAELKDQLAAGNDVVLAADLDLDADETIAIAAGKDVVIDLNGHTISTVSDTTGSNRNAFDVNGGTLTVKNGTISIKHEGANMEWNNSTNVFNVTAGGVLNIENATIENLGGSDMAFCVHLNNWGEVTLNAKNTTFKSTYVAIRVFNSGYDMNNVTLEDCYVEGTSNALWVHNYTAADFGTEEKANEQKELLNFDLSGNTYVGKGPIRLGMTNAEYGDESILP